MLLQGMGIEVKSVTFYLNTFKSKSYWFSVNLIISGMQLYFADKLQKGGGANSS